MPGHGREADHTTATGARVTAGDINAIIASSLAVAAIIGGGMKWFLSHVEAIQVKAALSEEKARTALSERLHEEIRILRNDLTNMHVEKNLFLRRIFQLEGFIHKLPGIDIPDMPGWPPV
jgi:hypothetical protein